jgi:hypothetical protein
MKARGRSGSIDPVSFNIFIKWVWMVSFTAWSLYPGESTIGTHLNRMCDEPESRSEQFGVEINFLSLLEIKVGRNSSVGLAIRYGLEGPDDRISVRARFSAPVQTGTGAHPPS